MAESDLVMRRLDEAEKVAAARYDGLHGELRTMNSRLDDFSARLAGVEARITALNSDLTTRFEGLENRLSSKASTTVMSIWGASLGVWMALLVGALGWFKLPR
jgi:hypothetical protein